MKERGIHVVILNQASVRECVLARAHARARVCVCVCVSELCDVSVYLMVNHAGKHMTVYVRTY